MGSATQRPFSKQFPGKLTDEVNMHGLDEKTREMRTGSILCGDAREILKGLPSASAHCCVTSPPYWNLRDYGVQGQLGIEASVEEHIEALVELFREVRRILRKDGTLWLNYGDTYSANRSWQSADSKHRDVGNSTSRNAQMSGVPPKNLIGLPWKIAFALQADGWYLRSDIIWHKPNPMPESIKDRPTRAHEYLFLLSQSERYYYDHEAIREPAAALCGYDATRMSQGSNRSRLQNPKALSFARKVNEPNRPGQSQPQRRPDRNVKHHSVRPGIDTRGGGQGRGEIVYPLYSRNRRDVWTIPTKPFADAHFATFPPDLIRPCILAGAPAGGVVLDPFFGAGTTGVVCVEEGRRYLGIELNPDYAAMAEQRIARTNPKGPRQLSLLNLGVA